MGMRLLVVAAVVGCAPYSGAVPACVVADISAPTRDTIYVVGVEPRMGGAASQACEHRGTTTPPVVITETPAPGADLRDVLDRGIPSARTPRPDVVVTREPTVISYATSSTGYFTVVLPYDRTYLLVTADSVSEVLSQRERDALARDAVTADARGAAPPFAWLADPTCVAPFVLSRATPGSVVAYAAGDPIARQLAERIVALAGALTRPVWLPASLASGAAPARVAALAADSIADALATGRAAAAVVILPRDSRARCGTPNAPLPWHGVPLVDSRAHAIVRRGSGAAFIIDEDGSLLFTRRSTP
jgi:hypothetical protein